MAAAVGGGMQAVEEALFNMKLADVKTVMGGRRHWARKGRGGGERVRGPRST